MIAGWWNRGEWERVFAGLFASGHLHKLSDLQLFLAAVPSPDRPVVFMLMDRWREEARVSGRLVERKGVGILE